MEIWEEQHCRLKEARWNLTTPLTSEVEASEPECYSGARPKTTRAKLISVAPGVLPQEAVAQIYNSSHSNLRQGQQLEDCAVLLRAEMFNVIPGTVNTQHGTASCNRKAKSGSDFSNDEVFHLHQVPDMHIAGSGHGHKVTFRSPVVRPGSVSSTSHLVPQPVFFVLSRIPETETSGKDTDSEAEVRPMSPHQKVKRMRNDASIASHSLQLMAEEFWKISEPKIKKLKGGYSANAMVIFNWWLKDVGMCVTKWKLLNMETVQLMKDYTMVGPRGAVEFYLNTNSTWKYEELIEHLRSSFESCKTFSLLGGDFYSHIQWPGEMEDQFANKLQILGQKEISVRPSWMNEVNEALKTQFASGLCDPYLVAMAHNVLKTQGNKMNFIQFPAECISMYGSQIKMPKVKTATNSISSSGTSKEQKSHSQKKGNNTYRKIQAEMDMIGWQKQEIENLKATQTTRVRPQQLVSAVSQVMSCLYVGDKKALTSSSSNGGKKFIVTPRPSKLSIGIDGSLDTNLTCWYCKDTGYKLDNFKQLQQIWSIVTEESLNTKHH